MRILIVTHLFAEQYGGEQVAARQLGLEWVNQGHEVFWAASGSVSNEDRKPFVYIQMKAWNPLEKRFGIPYPIWKPSSVQNLARAVLAAEVIHIHDSLFMGSVFAVLLARIFRKPFVVTQHIDLIPYKNWFLRMAMALGNKLITHSILSSANRVVFECEKTFKYFEKRIHFKNDPLIIQNGVDHKRFFVNAQRQKNILRRELRLSEEGILCLYVGRYVEKKGLHILEHLVRKFSFIQFIMIGHGPINPKSWNLPNVKDFGKQSQWNLTPYYQASDLLLLPSVGEGFPFVIQEAMASGTVPLVSREHAFAISGVSEHCFFAEPNKESFEKCLYDVLGRRQELIAKARECTEFAKNHWNWENCAIRYLQVFNPLATGSHHRAVHA